jgi:hypothetical protein
MAVDTMILVLNMVVYFLVRTENAKKNCLVFKTAKLKLADYCFTKMKAVKILYIFMKFIK